MSPLVPSCKGALTVTMSHCMRVSNVNRYTTQLVDFYLGDEILEVFDTACANLLCSGYASNRQMSIIVTRIFKLHTFRERVVVVVQQLFGVERLETLQHPVPNATGTKSTDDLAFEIVRVARNVGYLPVAAFNHLMRGHEVANKQENIHHDVLGDGDDV